MAVGLAGDERPQPNAVGRLGDRTQRRPALVGVPARVADPRLEVILEPDRVVAQRFGLERSVPNRVDIGAVLREDDSDLEVGRVGVGRARSGHLSIERQRSIGERFRLRGDEFDERLFADFAAVDDGDGCLLAVRERLPGTPAHRASLGLFHGCRLCIAVVRGDRPLEGLERVLHVCIEPTVYCEPKVRDELSRRGRKRSDVARGLEPNAAVGLDARERSRDAALDSGRFGDGFGVGRRADDVHPDLGNQRRDVGVDEPIDDRLDFLGSGFSSGFISQRDHVVDRAVALAHVGVVAHRASRKSVAPSTAVSRPLPSRGGPRSQRRARCSRAVGRVGADAGVFERSSAVSRHEHVLHSLAGDVAALEKGGVDARLEIASPASRAVSSSTTAMSVSTSASSTLGVASVASPSRSSS